MVDIDIINTADGSTANDEVVWHQNEFCSFASSFENTVYSDTYLNAPTSVRTGDIDGDGDTDAVVSDKNNATIKWYENTNKWGTAWSDHLISVDFGGATFVNVGDVDNDGDLDVVGVADASTEVTWWENADGVGGTWNAYQLDISFIGGTSVHSVDVDSDGDLDVLASAGNATGEIKLYKNTTIHRNAEFAPIEDMTNIFDPHIISTTAGGVCSVAAC